MATVVNVRVRSYERRDAPACCEVINEAVDVMDGLNDQARALVRSNNTPDQLGADLSRWTTLVADSSEQVVGVGALDDDEIKRVYVRPTAHGTGVATQLMTALETIAAARGVAKVRLDASPSSVQFYASLGYVARGDGELVIGEAEFRFIAMAKDLPSPP